MSQTVNSFKQQESDAGVARVDMKLEVALVPVSDVDRAKEFYTGLGWRLDDDIVMGSDFRVVQYTPPGSGCSISFGKGVTAATPGSFRGGLIVSNIEAAHKELVAMGINASEVFHGSPFSPAGRISGPDPERQSYRSYVAFEDPDGNVWIVQEVTHRVPGRIDPATTTFASANDLASAMRRAAAARGSRPRRAREAQRSARRELAGLVRSVHGGGAGRDRATDVNAYLLVTGKEKETTINEKMIIKEKDMKISQTYRSDSAPREPKSALRGLMQRLSITLFACTLTIGATEAQQVAPPIFGVIGKVQSFTGGSLDVQTPSGVVHVDVKQPLTTYKQIPSDLSHVTSASYVGVASTEQADGKQIAKQIIIFPAELSGAAEGSVLTDPPGATTHSRMTNGSVSRPAVSHSRMTNGTVQKGSGTTLVVQYQDGSKTISVPPNVPVTEVAPKQVTFANGDLVYAATEKLPNGTLATNKIFLFIPAAYPNANQ